MGFTGNFALNLMLEPVMLARVLPDSAANPDVPPFFARYVPSPHSVVTVKLVDGAGSPTRAARDEILSFFRRRLGGGAQVDAVSGAVAS